MIDLLKEKIVKVNTGEEPKSKSSLHIITIVICIIVFVLLAILYVFN